MQLTPWRVAQATASSRGSFRPMSMPMRSAGSTIVGAPPACEKPYLSRPAAGSVGDLRASGVDPGLILRLVAGIHRVDLADRRAGIDLAADPCLGPLLLIAVTRHPISQAARNHHDAVRVAAHDIAGDHQHPTAADDRSGLRDQQARE